MLFKEAITLSILELCNKYNYTPNKLAELSSIAPSTLSSFGAANLVSSIIGVAIFIVAIYGGYFLVTYNCN